MQAPQTGDDIRPGVQSLPDVVQVLWIRLQQAVQATPSTRAFQRVEPQCGQALPRALAIENRLESGQQQPRPFGGDGGPVDFRPSRPAQRAALLDDAAPIVGAGAIDVEHQRLDAVRSGGRAADRRAGGRHRLGQDRRARRQGGGDTRHEQAAPGGQDGIAAAGTRLRGPVCCVGGLCRLQAGGRLTTSCVHEARTFEGCVPRCCRYNQLTENPPGRPGATLAQAAATTDQASSLEYRNVWRLCRETALSYLQVSGAVADTCEYKGEAENPRSIVNFHESNSIQSRRFDTKQRSPEN